METTTSLNPHAAAAAAAAAKPTLLHPTLKTPYPNPPIQIQLPLRRPQYKPPPPPKPITIKPTPKPVSTTSDILRLMDGLKLPIPSHLYASLIKECTETGDPFKAIELHQHVRRSGLRLNLHLLNRILLMHVSSGCYGHARQLFDQMFLRDFNSWAVVIAGCVENGECSEAVDLFIKMIREQGFFVNVSENQMGFSVPGILVCVLKACLCNMDLRFGTQVHGWLWKMGYSGNVALHSFLIKFYGELKSYESARSVFEQASYGNTVVWTSRIVSSCRDDNFEEAVSVFKEMGREGVRKNGYTFSSVLKACRRMGDIGCGQQVHANVMKLGLESNDFVQCALVDLYGKCGFLKDASRAYEIGRNERNTACCNAMLLNYTRRGLCNETNKILYEMKVAGFIPYESVFNEVGFVCRSRVSQNNMDEVYI